MDVSINAHNHDEFLAQFPIGSYLQGRFWKHFLKLQKKKYWQLSVYKKSELIAHCLVYTTNLPLGKSYLYAPKGPFISPAATPGEQQESLELLLSQLRDLTIATRRREEIFCRLEPNVNPPQLKSIHWTPSAPIQPQVTIYKKLDTGTEEILKSFKEKTRYNIRLAEKKGVTIQWSDDEKALKIFLNLHLKSAARQRIRTHSNKYFELLREAGKEFNAVHIGWAEYNNRPIAANLYIQWRPTMVYAHGGFDYTYRNLMAPYLLQWTAIQRAQNLGLQYFDFRGFAPPDKSRPSWEGFSRFKEGFGGSVMDSPGCFDFIYNPLWHNVYNRVRGIRRKLRI